MFEVQIINLFEKSGFDKKDKKKDKKDTQGR